MSLKKKNDGKKTAPRKAPREAKTGRSRDAELARLRVLYKISNILTATQRHDDVLRAIIREAVKVTRATSGSIILIDREAGVLNIKFAHNIDRERIRRVKLRIGEGVTGWAAKTGKPLLVGDVRRSRHYVAIKAEVRSELAVPIAIGGEVVGVINVDSNREDAFDEADKELLVAVAAQSARVMQTAQLYEENQLRAQRLATLFHVTRTIVSQPLLEDVLRAVTEEVRRLMNVRVCSILLLDEKGESFEVKAVSGEVSRGYVNRGQVPARDKIVGRVVETRRPLYIPDVRRERGFSLGRVARESGLCSLLSIPMTYLEKPIGVLNIYTDKPRRFPDEDVELLSAFAGHATVAIVNARRLERIFKSEELLRASEKFQLLGALSAEIAHEIRNPLAILSMLIHAVQNDPLLSAQSRGDLGVMESKLTHINRIVDQVLDFSRARQEEPVPVDLNQIVDDVEMMIGYKAADMGRETKKRLDESLPSVMGDPGQIEQAVLNIALNGLEAMQTRGRRLTFTSQQSEIDGQTYALVRIRDEGVGIPKEQMQEIFTPYFSMRDRGTGLGLFISRRIIDQHGGRLRVRSRVDRGSTFDILLPIAGASDSA